MEKELKNEGNQLNWSFKPGIEQGLKETAEMFASVMQKCEVSVLRFRILGFNACRVAIRADLKDPKKFDVMLEEEDFYEAHCLDGDSHKEWKKKREQQIKEGYIQNQTLHLRGSVPISWHERVKNVMDEVVPVWASHRINEIDELSFMVKEEEKNRIWEFHCYYDKNGIIVVAG